MLLLSTLNVRKLPEKIFNTQVEVRQQGVISRKGVYTKEIMHCYLGHYEDLKALDTSA